jgi:hypothetical protein
MRRPAAACRHGPYGEGVAEPRLPYRARPLQVLLAVGAVLVVTAAVAVVSGPGGAAARVPLLALAVVTAGLSVGAAWSGLRSTEETLGACCLGFALAAVGWRGAATAVLLLLLAAVLAALAGLARTTAAWPLGAWLTLQLAVLRSLDLVPGPLHSSLFLTVALGGLGIALRARPPVARVAFLTTVPWWLAGVLSGTTTAWTGDRSARQGAALLVVAAAAGLLAARLRHDLDVFLGPPLAVPVLAGVVAGTAVSGALATFGTPGITAGGYVGVLMAATLPERLHGMLRPVAVAGGSALALAALAELSLRHGWGALVVLFLLTASPTLLVAWRRPAERSTALPWALGCLTAAAVFAVPAGWLGPRPVDVVLTALYAAGLAVAAKLPEQERTPTLVAAGAAAVAGLVLVTLQGDRGAIAVLLVAHGLITVEWGVWTAGPPAWRVGAAQATAGALLAVSTTEVHVLEEYTLPLAAGLLLAQGPRLRAGASWPAWGPGLLVAAVPSAVLAVVLPGGTRPIAVLAGAAVVMVLAGATGVRAPLVIGAATAVGTTLALALAALLWPVAAALLIGAGLLVVGARREQFPTPSFATPLAKLR